MADRMLFDLGLLFVLSGFALAFLAFLSLFASSLRGGAKGGAVVFIGPIPIIFGTGRGSKALMAIALAMAAIFISLFALPHLMGGRP